MSKVSKGKILTDGGHALGDNPFYGLKIGGLSSRVAAPESAKNEVAKLKSKGRVEVRREKAGRGGKTVTTLREFPTHIPSGELESLLVDLKKACACGGTLKGRSLELQGDICDKVLVKLEKRGYKPVRAGG